MVTTGLIDKQKSFVYTIIVSCPASGLLDESGLQHDITLLLSKFKSKDHHRYNAQLTSSEVIQGQ